MGDRRAGRVAGLAGRVAGLAAAAAALLLVLLVVADRRTAAEPPATAASRPPASSALAATDQVAPGTGPPGTPTAGPADSPREGRAAGDEEPADQRTREVRALLDRRAAAVLARDRAAFLEGLDPRATEFAARQAAVFDALAGVPLGSWSYELDPTRESDAGGLEQRHGGPVWVPQVTLTYGYAGMATRPAVAAQVFTFVRRDGAWRIASDSDLDGGPVRTARAPWDSGPVVAVRGERSLVLGHPESRPALEGLAAEADAAVPRVTAVWGDDWARQVVVVLPRDVPEMRDVVGQDLELGSIAAVATAQLPGGPGRYEPVGDRVVVHPENYPRLGTLGRRIVLTHEVAHVAARAASGPAVPAWLVEGLADHIGYAGTGLTLDQAAPQTAAQVRAGRVPASLPTAADFAGPDLVQAYETAYLAVHRIAETHGEAALLRLYRTIGGAAPGSDADAVVAAAFPAVLGQSLEEFTADWSHDLARRLA